MAEMTGRGQTLTDSIWVARIIDYSDRFLPGGPLVSTIVSLGVIPIGLTAIFFSLTSSEASPNFVVSQILMVVLTIIGTFLIRYYDKSLFPEFLEQVSTIVVTESKLIRVIDRYKIFFSKKFWLTAVPWTTLLILAIIFNIGFFYELGVNNYRDFSFIVYLAFISWFGVITGIGLHMVVTTILCIRDIGNLELQIDPLHPDQLGGLSNIGMFAIRTTMMNSIGALSFPLGFTLAAHGEYESLIYSVVTIYIVFILFSFIYPTAYINKRAEDIREEELEKQRKQICELRKDAIEDPFTGDDGHASTEKQLQLQILKEEFKEYQSVRLYPFTLSILTRLVSSVLLPLGFLILETYIISG